MEPVDEKMAKDLKGKSRDAFDAQAATYDADMYGSHARSLYPHVIDEVKRAVEGIDSPRLLDLGCGTGALAEALLEEIANACLACVDLSPKMLELAKERLAGRADVSLVDVEGCPFRIARSTPHGATTRSTTTRILRRRRFRCGAS